MGDSTAPATNVPVKKKRQLDTSTVIAVVAVAIAIAALVISILQVDVARSQNTAAQQQQLESLTTLIAQQFPSAGQTETLAIAADLQVEGQAGAVLINDLNHNGVASIEYVQVARALNDSGNSAEARTYYENAINAPPDDAETQATALRYLGELYYDLDQPAIAHRYMMQAVKVFNGHPVEPQWYKASSIAQGYLLDAENQIPIKGGCRVATSDIAAAENAIGSYTETSLDQNLMDQDEVEYKSDCKDKA